MNLITKKSICSALAALRPQEQQQVEEGVKTCLSLGAGRAPFLETQRTGFQMLRSWINVWLHGLQFLKRVMEAHVKFLQEVLICSLCPPLLLVCRDYLVRK
ncbi:Hypothetical predicted protein [Xyrichtys novacula]|uniref:Uncharacterized protein n=1 Tax=Xyrichtys novacula TaxID=13765 RepID=A0AAV1G712_XYRNO|nr:Hypothetical predicted protein [Xyrichtys novacula]